MAKKAPKPPKEHPSQLPVVADRRHMRHPYQNLTKIATPIEGMGHPNIYVYRLAHARQMATVAAKFPALGFSPTPWDAPDGAIPWVNGGKWTVTCACGDCPMACPEWDEVRCFLCGAVYRNLIWPPQREALERLLVKRPAHVRAWFPGESLDDIRAENLAHGVGI